MKKYINKTNGRSIINSSHQGYGKELGLSDVTRSEIPRLGHKDSSGDGAIPVRDFLGTAPPLLKNQSNEAAVTHRK